MKKIIPVLLAVALVLGSCESKQQKAIKIKLHVADSTRIADSLKIALANSLGMWEIGYYTDEFGDRTKSKFVTNSKSIFGTFSNSATEGSDLRVRLLIDEQPYKNEKFIIVQIQLFEYAGSNPVKEGLNYGYDIKVRSDTSEEIELSASCSSDRLNLGVDDSKKLSELLLKGGQMKFFIIERSNYSKSSYRFVLENTNGFINAIKKLTE